MIDYVISIGFMVFIVYNRQGNVNNNHVIIEYDFGFVVIIYQGEIPCQLTILNLTCRLKFFREIT